MWVADGLKRLTAKLGGVLGRRSASVPPDATSAEPGGRDLVVPRPPHFASREYTILDDDDDRVEALFQRFRAALVRRSQGLGSHRLGEPPPFRAEFGRLALGRSQRSYCYLQPWNEQGWLIERTPTGWFIAPADKNIVTDTFMRTNMAWDSVTLFRPEDETEGLLRIRSSRHGEELISYPVYEDAILKELGLKVEAELA